MLNSNVFIVNTKAPRLIDPKQTVFSKINTTVIVDSISDDSLVLQTILNATGYTAVDLRKKIQRAEKPEKVLNETLFPDYAGIISDSCIIENQNDITSPIKIKYFYKMEKEDGGSEGYIYIKPLRGLQFPKFIAEKRTLPINFFYKREYNQYFILKIPAEYEVIDMPNIQSYSLPDKAANFVLNVKNENNLLTFRLVY